MIELIVDIILYVVLFAAIGFGIISVMGLVVFPDPKSRAFTGLRAGVLAMALASLAGICYGLFSWYSFGGDQYLLFILASAIMLALVVFLDRITAKSICRTAAPQKQT